MDRRHFIGAGCALFAASQLPAAIEDDSKVFAETGGWSMPALSAARHCLDDKRGKLVRYDAQGQRLGDFADVPDGYEAGRVAAEGQWLVLEDRKGHRLLRLKRKMKDWT